VLARSQQGRSGFYRSDEGNIMDNSEIEVLSLAIVINLNHILEQKLLEPPLEVTITDVNDQTLLDAEFGKGGKFRDVFGIGPLPMHWDEYRFPVTVAVVGNDDDTRTFTITADLVHEYLADAKKLIQ
jgi:hypothetical protein